MNLMDGYENFNKEHLQLKALTRKIELLKKQEENLKQTYLKLANELNNRNIEKIKIKNDENKKLIDYLHINENKRNKIEYDMLQVLKDKKNKIIKEIKTCKKQTEILEDKLRSTEEKGKKFTEELNNIKHLYKSNTNEKEVLERELEIIKQENETLYLLLNTQKVEEDHLKELYKANYLNN